MPVPANYGACALPSCSVPQEFGNDPQAQDLAVFRPSNGTWYVWGIETVQ